MVAPYQNMVAQISILIFWGVSLMAILVRAGTKTSALVLFG